VRGLGAICGREVRSFFRSAMAPVVLTVFMLLTGFFFSNTMFTYSELSLTTMKSGAAVNALLTLADGVFQPLAVNMSVFLLFVLPAVSMRLFAEEYRSGRYDLVMSYPVADHVWVLGKFLSVAAAALVMVALSGAYFIVAFTLGGAEFGPLFSVLLGLALIAILISAWGTFFSTLVPYQVVSYILCFAFVLVLYTIGSLEPFLPGPLADFSLRMSLSRHFMRFSRGVVDSRDLIYMLGWTVLGLAAATAALSGRRLAGGRRWARWTPFLVLLLLVGTLDLIAARNPLTFDMTSNRRHSLAPQTEQVLESLEADVEVTAFYQRLDPNRRVAEVALNAFADATPRFSFRMVDPDRELGLVQRYGVTTVRTVVVEARGRRRDLPDPDESALINAVYRVVLGTQPVVYHLQGHGEPALDLETRDGYSAYLDALESQGYLVRPLLLADVPAVPSDGAVLVIASPRRDLRPAEIEAVQRFVADGGSVLALLDPGAPASIAEWAGRYDVTLGEDFLVSRSGASTQFGVDDRVVILFEYGPHDITKGLSGLATFFPFVQSLQPSGGAHRGMTARTILRTSPASWAERDLASLAAGEMDFDEGVDLPGPLPFGVAIEIDRREYFGEPEAGAARLRQERPEVGDEFAQSLRGRTQDEPRLPPSIFTRDESSRMIVVGDAGFAANEHLDLYGNRDLLLNMVGWLAGEKVLIAQRAREDRSEPVVLSVSQKRWLGWGCTLGWPLLAGLFSAVAVVRRRRNG